MPSGPSSSCGPDPVFGVWTTSVSRASGSYELRLPARLFLELREAKRRLTRSWLMQWNPLYMESVRSLRDGPSVCQFLPETLTSLRVGTFGKGNTKLQNSRACLKANWNSFNIFSIGQIYYQNFPFAECLHCRLLLASSTLVFLSKEAKHKCNKHRLLITQ